LHVYHPYGLAEKNGTLQLLFWEDLNRLLNPALRVERPDELLNEKAS